MDTKVKVVEVTKGRQTSVLANAVVELVFPDGESVTIHDLRVLMNKSQQPWVALPAFSVPQGGRNFTYQPTVELSRLLMREVAGAVLDEFEKWQAQQVVGGGAA